MLKLTEPKKVLCIHDLSGVGRCSLAVILPVLSVMGVQPVALPTVVLSTHTGGLGTPARLDGCDYGMAALEHYRELGLEFDCIYTGYLGGEAQAAIAEKAKENVKKVYESTVSHSMKFLWIKNIWQTDASFKHPVLKYSDFQSSVLNKFDKQSVSPYDEESYNIVTEKLGDYKTQANGYYILIVLSIGTILLQQFITMRSQKEQQKFSSADGTGAANQKMMMVVMTVMFAIFSFMYSAAFSIYMVTSNVVSMIMTLIINKAVTVAMTKQEEKKLQQKYDNRFPGRTYQSGKDGKKKK